MHFSIHTKRRLDLIYKAIGSKQMNNIKLVEKDLPILVEEAAKMIRTRFELMILPYEGKDLKQFFNEECVDFNDWTSNLKLVSKATFVQLK